MATLPARVIPKKSSAAGEAPQAADLEVAEIAVNTADGKLFVKHTDDSIKEINPTSDYISLTDLKAEVAASTDFADFQSRIAAL